MKIKLKRFTDRQTDRQTDWINCAKFLAILAMLTDHTNLQIKLFIDWRNIV